jgi:hypothetical protein
LKDQLRCGDISLSQAIDLVVDDPVLCHIKVADLLRAVRRVGPKRAADILQRHGISPGRRCRGLGRRQIAGLKAEFDGSGETAPQSTAH